MTAWATLLENDLRWREAELASLKRIVIVSSGNNVTYQAMLRASWALLYAHFEGFTKFCWDVLLDQVQQRNLSISQLDPKFQLLALEKPFRELRGNMSSSSILNFYSVYMPELLKNTALFHQDYRPNPDSNLWPNVFERECSRVGIVSEQLNEQRSRIRTLVSRRNDIAHGKTMTINSIAEYSEYENAVMLVLHELAVTILDIIEQEKYMTVTSVNSKM